jgi:exopolysaccharide biosynthesis WecB/TagA/CpsF family protein
MTYSVLGVQIAATDYEAATERVIAAAKSRSPLGVTALAVHGVMTGVEDSIQRYRLNALDMCLPDGQPVRWALNWLHRCGLRERVYGPSLMLSICTRAASEGLSIFLYGSTPEVLERLKSNLNSRFPLLVIAGAVPSQFRTISLSEKTRVVGDVRASGASIVFCGLGCPRQEVWTYEYREALGVPVIAVGAAFDFIAGTVRQAPSFLQRHGLEWAFRLASEPGRLWRRYLFLNPRYLALLAAQKLGVRKFDCVGTRPSAEVGFG